jgi:PAS domain S-box-containing protein
VVAVLTVPAETPFEEMKRYVRFMDADARLLADLHERVAPSFPRVVAEFYDRIREHEGAHDVLTGEEQVERLQQSLARWLHRVFSGRYDEAYFEETAKIGRVHVRVGLPQRYMFVAMALIRSALQGVIEDVLGGGSAPARDALNRLLDVELAIMVGAYGDDQIARIQRADRLERDRVDRSLARTEHRYQYAVELAQVLFIGLDAQARVRLFNHEAERVTGFARDEVIGTRFVDLLPDELADEHGPLIAQAAAGAGAGPDIIDGAIRTRSGKVRDVRWQLAYSPSESDEEVVLFAIGQDTTDENALAARVRQSEKLAALGTLAAGLAHEIRNPLNGAQLHLTVLERDLKRGHRDDAEALDTVRVVGDEIRRLDALVSEFLQFARPRPLDLEACSVRAVCERAVRLVSPAAAAASVQIEADLPASDITIEADGAKIQQVLLNLLQNAVEATAPGGGGTVTVRARRRPKQAMIEVEDDGPGLPSPDAPVFDAFYSTKPHGTGLGLAIAHRIVTDHGGSIDVQSRPGSTVFRVALPIRLS